MALNLFTQTFLAHQAASSKGEAPSFLICEQDDTRADNFIAALRERAGSEASDKIHRVGSGKECDIRSY
jgi:3-hydroxyisobutyrate dehydrogenase